MVTNKCAICSVSCGDKEHAGQCIVCKSIYYCSPVCQKIDWPLHKILCQKYADFEKNNPRPADIVEDRKTTFHKLAILFSGDSTAIELIWLGAELHSEIDDKTDELLEFSSSTSWPFYEYLGAAKGIEFVKNERIIEVMVGGGTLGRTPNVAIENLCKGYSTAHSYSHNKSYRLGSGFSGNLTITHKKTESRPEAKNPSVDVHQDVTLEDFRYGFNWITQQYNVFDCNSANKFLVRGADSWTKGVMIKCPKDVELSASVAKYQEVLLKYRDSIDGLKHGATSVHRLFRTSDTCSISEQMGMELSYDELGCSTFRQANLGTCRGYQRIASILINADPQSEFWGSEFPKSLSNRLKYMDMQDALNTIAAETDKRHLTRFQVEALVEFSQDVFYEAVDRDKMYDEGGELDEEEYVNDETRHGKIVEQYLQSDEFEKYFFEYRQQKIDDGDASWIAAGPPPRKYPVKIESENIDAVNIKFGVDDDAETNGEKRERGAC